MREIYKDKVILFFKGDSTLSEIFWIQMKTTKAMLRINAERFLDKLKEEKVDSIETALKLVDQRIGISETLPDYIDISLTPSNHGTNALKLSYGSSEFEGNPIELIVNQQLGYRQTVLRCVEPVRGYGFYGADRFGNIHQFRKVDEPGWKEVMHDLEELIRCR